MSKVRLCFAFVPPGDYQVGQVIETNDGKLMISEKLESGNFIAYTRSDAPVQKRVVCIVADSQPIVAQEADHVDD